MRVLERGLAAVPIEPELKAAGARPRDGIRLERIKRRGPDLAAVPAQSAETLDGIARSRVARAIEGVPCPFRLAGPGGQDDEKRGRADGSGHAAAESRRGAHRVQAAKPRGACDDCAREHARKQGRGDYPGAARSGAVSDLAIVPRDT